MPRQRTNRLDRLLLVTLVPLWLVVFGLHLYEIGSSGFRELPVMLRPAADAPGQWEVYGHRLDLDSAAVDLRRGDRIVAVGTQEVSNTGRFEVLAIAIAEADRAGHVPIEVLRDGELVQIDGQLIGPPSPWMRAPGLALFVVVGIIVLLRAVDRALARRFFLATIAVATLLTPFPGGSTAQALAHYWVFNASGGLAMGLTIDMLRRFPQELPERLCFGRGWAVAVALFWYAPRFVAFPEAIASQLPHVVDACNLVLMCTILTRNYRRSSPIGRRRVRWLMFGFAFAAIPFLLILLASLIDSGSRWVPVMQALSVPGLWVVTVTMLIAIVRYNVFDIDRLLSQAATALIAVGVLFAGLLLLMPGLGALLVSSTGLSVETARVIAAIAIAGVVTAGGWRLRPELDRLLFPERRKLIESVEALSEAIAGCRTLREVSELLGDQLSTLLGSRKSAVYARAQDGFAPVVATGSAPRIAGDEAWLRSFELRGGVSSIDAPAGIERHALTAADRQRISELGFSVFVSMRREATLAAFVALGPKASDDVYTATDIALLALIGDRASAQLDHFDDAELLREGRVLAEALRGEKEAAVRASSEKTHLLAAASHDIRQPVHALGLLIGALSDRTRGSELEPLVDKIAAAGRSVEEMIDGLLDLSRLDAGVLVPVPERIALDPLIERVVKELEAAASRKDTRLHYVPTTAWVESDPLLLRRIVQNLLSNAVRYTERGRVLVGVRHLNGKVRIEVHDTGRGLSPAQQERMFDEYQRFAGAPEAPTRDGQPGLGLGLAIVRRLAALLGHPIGVRSTPSRGSVFSIELPRVAALEPRASAARAAGTLDVAKVLVVDDDPAVREGIFALLEGVGCEVKGSASVAETVELLRTGDFRPSLLIVDYWLGETETGLDAIAAVEAALGGALPTLLVSADGSVEAPAGSGLIVLRKPVSPMRLRAAIQHVMKSGSAADGNEERNREQ